MSSELQVMPESVSAVVDALHAPKETALSLFSPFREPFENAAKLLMEEPSATDPKAARELRLRMVKARTGIAAVKDSAKADIKLAANIIDWYHNKGRDQLAEAEARLDAIEKAAARAEAERKAAIRAIRMAELSAVGVDGQYYPLAEMPDAAYSQLLESSTIAHTAKIEAERKAAEEARIAAEKAEAERIKREAEEAAERARIKAEAERLRIENERLAKERAEVEAKAKAEAAAAAEAARKEREALEAKARAEREEAARLAKIEREKREALEAAEAARIAAEKKREAEARAAAKRAAAAPDREKLASYGSAIKALALPEMDTAEGKASAARINASIAELLELIRREWQSLQGGAQ